MQQLLKSPQILVRDSGGRVGAPRLKWIDELSKVGGHSSFEEVELDMQFFCYLQGSKSSSSSMD